MGAAKSTVARLLAARFERGVHVDGDVFRRSIVSGRVATTLDPPPAALQQLRLRYRLAAAAADEYFRAGFTVVLEDVVAGELLGEYRTLIRSRPCHVVVLLPSVEAAAARASSSEDDGLYEAFATATPRVGVWLDSSNQTPEQTVEEILARTPSETRPVVVTDYDERWPRVFDEIAEPVRRALGEVAVAVEHVGSTAVPGLAAKPVIDVDVVVGRAAEVPVAIERLRELGYVYQGDKGIAGREALMWPAGAPPHHLYVVVAGSEPHADHVDFRDYLRAHPDVAQQYAALKMALAAEHADDRTRYTEAKSSFVGRVLTAVRTDAS